MDREKAIECIRLLEEQYGVPGPVEAEPVDLLIMTILSQNTSDKNSLPAFAALKARFGEHEALLAASEEAIVECIRSGGLAEIKARRIKEVLQRIRLDFGSIALDSLAGFHKDAAMQYLLSLPGVGPKTASIVLLFAFHMPFFPVDTHVYRLARRLGLIEEDIRIDRAGEALERIVPPERYFSFHLNLIRHGRLVCRARAPKHDDCSLRGCCDLLRSGQKV